MVTTKFLHSENIFMLWNIMKSTPFFIHDFHDDRIRKQWFHHILYKFNENPSNTIEKLNILNHQVVKYMIMDLQTNHNNNKKENKEEINDRSKIESDPSRNIDELVKIHMNERDLVLDQSFPTNTTETLRIDNNHSLNIHDSITDLSHKKVTFYDESEEGHSMHDQLLLIQENFQKQILLLQDTFQQQLQLIQSSKHIGYP